MHLPRAVASRLVASRVLLALLAPALVPVLASCIDVGPPSAHGISMFGGTGQSVIVGTAAQPFVVGVLDQSGALFSGATVSWAVTSGGGSVAPTASVSDANGLAQTVYTAGSTVGVATVTATVGGRWSVPFRIQVIADTTTKPPGAAR